MNPQNLHAHEDRLLDFAYGELPVPEARAVEAHLQGCVRCTQALQDIRGVRATMSQLSSLEPAPDAGLESLLAYAHQAARRNVAGPAPKPSRWRRWLLPVVGLASISTLGILTFQANDPALTRPDLSQAMVAETARLKEEAPARGAPAPASAVAPAPAPQEAQTEYAQAPIQDAPAEKLAEEVQMGKGALKAKSQLAENWANSGSGGGLDTRRSRDAEAKQLKKDMSFGGEERSRGVVAKKPAATGKLAGSKLAELDEESTAGAEGLAYEAPKSAPKQEPLRVGGPSQALAGVASDDMTADALTLEPEAEAPADEDKAAPSMPTGSAAPAAAMPSTPAPVVAIGRADQARERAEEVVAERRAPSAITTPLPSKAKRAEPGTGATAPAAPPPPVQRQAASASDRGPSVAELARKALEANAAGDRAQEAALLRSALAAGAVGSERWALLNRLCDAELTLGRHAAGRAACNQVLAEDPGSSAAQVARRRLSRGDASLEAPAKPAEPAK